jgi:ADP-heptose:LPS heptosyltransferase
MSGQNFVPSTVLVYVGLDFIGDALMKMPFVVALRQAFPEARITWLAGKGRTVFRRELAPLAEGLIDEVIEDAGIGSHWSEIRARPLGGRRFDLVVDTQRRFLTTLLLRRIPARRFVSGAANFLLSDARPPAGYARPAELIRQLLDLVDLAAGRRIEAPRFELRAPEFVAAATRLLPDGAVHVGFVPGSSAGRAEKRWPLDRYVALARMQAARGRVPVFVLGPEEAAWRDEIAAAVPGARFPLQEESGTDARGPLLTIALAARLAAAVSNDSGGGHLVAAGGVPLVSLWGPSVMAKAPPQSPRLITVDAREFASTSMDAIPIERVDAALEALLAAPR